MTLCTPWQHGTDKTPGEWVSKALALHTARSDEVEHASAPRRHDSEHDAEVVTFRDNAGKGWACVVVPLELLEEEQLDAVPDGTGDQLAPLAEGEHQGEAIAGERLEVDDLGPGLEAPAGAGGVGELSEEAPADGS